MQFKIKITSGGEVNWVGIPSSEPTYYGGPPPESGSWKLDMVALGDFIDRELTDTTFGQTIDVFVLGFEIGDLEGWGNFFTAMSNYTSYRPKMKLVVSVGQLNWPDVKDLDEQRQFECFAEVLLLAVSRVSELKRKPKDFDVIGFSNKIRSILAACPVAEVTARAA
jgi:hypothetical protein